MIRKLTILLISFLATLTLFISCCELDDIDPEWKVRGLRIDNLPEWTKDVLASEWKPWNTEETSEFKKLFKQKESLNSDNINYRLFVEGQNIVLFFDDEERTMCNPLWVWVAETENSWNLKISIPQEKEDEFVFTGYAKSNPAENNTENCKAYVKISLIDKNTGECNYILKVNDKEIINENLKACDSPTVEIPYSFFMDTFGFFDEKNKDKKTLMFTSVAQCRILNLSDNRFISHEFLYFEGLKQPPLYDEKSKTLTYELLGGTENMCHYLDIHYVNKDEIICSYYDIIEGEKKVKYTELLDTLREVVFMDL